MFEAFKASQKSDITKNPEANETEIAFDSCLSCLLNTKGECSKIYLEDSKNLVLLMLFCEIRTLNMLFKYSFKTMCVSDLPKVYILIFLLFRL